MSPILVWRGFTSLFTVRSTGCICTWALLYYAIHFNAKRHLVHSQMPFELCIHTCIREPRHRLHPPPPNLPLRTRIQGPLESIEKLLPDVNWKDIVSFPQPGGIDLAMLTHEALYGKKVHAETGRRLVVRDEYLAWAMSGRRPLDYIDYYGVTFDHLGPLDDADPELLVINIIELEAVSGPYADGELFAKDVLPFPVNPSDYVGRKVLAVPRCCQHKKGTQDRRLINGMVNERDRRLAEQQGDAK